MVWQETTVAKENKAHLKESVEEEWRLWGTMTNENDKIQHFSSGSTGQQLTNNNLFLCLLWKMLLETDDISPAAYKVIQTGP